MDELKQEAILYQNNHLKTLLTIKLNRTMRKLTLIIIMLLTSTMIYSQNYVQRFISGLQGPVCHSDVDLEVYMIHNGKTLKSIMPKNVDYYVVYK